LGGLLNNARKFFQGLSPPAPIRAQRYSVACPDGHRLSGVRTDGYQALRCPTCGEGIFVLPRSPLPDPGRPLPGSPPAVATRTTYAPLDEEPVALTDPVMVSSSDDVEPDGTIEWIDEEAGAESNGAPHADAELDPVPAPRGDPYEAAQAELSEAPVRTRRPRPKSPGPEPSGAGAKARRGPRSSAPERVAVAAPEPFDLGAWARSKRNPLLFAAVVLVVVGTVAFRNWRSRLAELPLVAERGRVEGLAALDAGKFDLAYQILSEARRAVHTLGDDFQGASAIKQGADEAEVIASSLSTRSSNSLTRRAAPTGRLGRPLPEAVQGADRDHRERDHHRSR